MVSELQNGNKKTLSGGGASKHGVLSNYTGYTPMKPALGRRLGSSRRNRCQVFTLLPPPGKEQSAAGSVIAWSWCLFTRNVPQMAGPGVGVHEPARTQDALMFCKPRQRSQWLNLEQVKLILLQSHPVSNQSKGSDYYHVLKRAFPILKELSS